MIRELRTAVLALLLLSVLTGVVYPLLVTGVAQVAFRDQANGSLLHDEHGKLIGSHLIGQSFDDERYFWGRLSATAPPYNAAASSGSNLGPSNPALVDAAKARLDALGVPADQVPVDLVTASGSGLDPHISPRAARIQVPRVARARGLPEELVRALLEKHIQGRQLGLLGEPRVDVLELNLALDALQ
jgi:potassium-transporting ATPase KdpC subunit